jgi:amidophosphoribosyltransferase
MAGISAVFSDDRSTLKTYNTLFQVHHRGQDSCGIAAAGDESIRTYSGNGRMKKVLEGIIKSFAHPTDYASIGYVGKEKDNEKNVPPIKMEFEDYDISLAMDGMVLNSHKFDNQFNLKTPCDEELFGTIFYNHLRNTEDLDEAAYQTMKELDKAYYSLVMLVLDKNKKKTEFVGLRDKRGIKPMYTGINKNSLIVVSESGAVDYLERFLGNKMERRDVKPGEILVKSKDGFYSKQLLTPKRAECVFEWVYISRPDAKMNGIESHAVRKELGRSLARIHSDIIKDDGNTVVIPVPDSGRSVTTGIAKESGIFQDEGMIKNQYVARTFIISDPKKRSEDASLKHNPIESAVRGKRLVIGDDSIVRGTISENVSRILKGAGAEEVIYAVSYSPIIERCFEEPGKELAAAKFKNLDFREIGIKLAENLPSIDYVIYNDFDSVVKAIGIPKNQLCTYCISGENPFK